MIKEVPILGEYCSPMKGNEYYCQKLQNVLFNNANYYTGNSVPYFNYVTENVLSETHLEKFTRENISYNVKNLMESKEHPVTIIETCNNLEKVCIKYRTQDKTKFIKKNKCQCPIVKIIDLFRYLLVYILN